MLEARHDRDDIDGIHGAQCAGARVEAPIGLRGRVSSRARVPRGKHDPR
jgi:hypothetical protein